MDTAPVTQKTKSVVPSGPSILPAFPSILLSWEHLAFTKLGLYLHERISPLSLRARDDVPDQ